MVFTAIAVLGIALCSLWYVTIGSYRQLNAGKFKVIHEMEENLPFACYTKEWRILRTEEGGKKYRRLTRVEQRVPLVMAGPGLPPGLVVEEAVGLVDLAPTLLSLAQLPPFSETSGIDLRQIIAGEEAPERV